MARPKRSSGRRGATTAPPAPRLGVEPPTWLPLAVAIAGALALLAFQLFRHHLPLYGVETDLIGDLIPAARALRTGRIEAAHYEFKGPGYPLLLAVAGAVVRDDWLAARLINVACAAVGAWLAARIAARFLGVRSGVFVACGLFVNPTWALAGIEAGTDMPAFALSMAATDLALRARRPATWGAAGLLASAAILTRHSAVSLVPAAVIAAIALHRRGPGPRAWASLVPYAAGVAFPLLAWTIIGQIATGGTMHNRNYLNVAFDIYARNATWDGFWADAGQRFHSWLDVLTLDPARVAGVLGSNAALRWYDDIWHLVPVWIGVPAVAGMLLMWPRRPGALAVAAHFVFAYLVLTTVFYNTRFFLYLLPFYLMGASALLFVAPVPSPAGTSRWFPVIPPALRSAAALAMLVGSGFALRSEVLARFDAEPTEVLAAARTLRRISPQGGRVMARKPHVAYFAGMDLVMMPQADTFLQLFAAARETRADFLFYSGLEARMREAFWLLDAPGFSLPGLEPIEQWVFTRNGYYSLYRFTPGPPDTAAIVAALLDQIPRIARAGRGDPSIVSLSGTTLVQIGRPAEAIPYLSEAAARNPADRQVLGWRARAYFETGDYASAASDCEQACTAADAPARTLRLLGLIRLALAQPAAARDAWRGAVEGEASNPDLLFELAVMERALGNDEASRAAFERSEKLAPAMAEARRETLATISPGASPQALLALLRNGAR
jgi:tetratricopeptide (TPR) repeat protein